MTIDTMVSKIHFWIIVLIISEYPLFNLGYHKIIMDMLIQLFLDIMLGSRNYRQGGSWPSDKKSSDHFFFLVLSLFYLSQMVNFEKKLSFFNVPEGVQHFPGGGGGGGPTYSL